MLIQVLLIYLLNSLMKQVTFIISVVYKLQLTTVIDFVLIVELLLHDHYKKFLKLQRNVPPLSREPDEAVMEMINEMFQRQARRLEGHAHAAVFLAFFGAFAWVIYPLRDMIHPTAFAGFLRAALPAGFAAPIAVLQNWTYSLFYLLANMWGSVVVSLLFWGFANEITTVSEAKKYYPLFGMFANVALVCACSSICALCISAFWSSSCSCASARLTLSREFSAFLCAACMLCALCVVLLNAASFTKLCAMCSML